MALTLTHWLISATALIEGAAAKFDVIAVGADGARAARKAVAWPLYGVSNDYQWYRVGRCWSFELVKSSQHVAGGKIDLGLAAPAKISAIVGLEIRFSAGCGPRRSRSCGSRKTLARHKSRVECRRPSFAAAMDRQRRTDRRSGPAQASGVDTRWRGVYAHICHRCARRDGQRARAAGIGGLQGTR
jgi:hypothetical protein